MAYRRGPRNFVPPQEAHKINRRIRAPQVRLIGADSSQVGIVPIEEALRHAEDLQLDLVEVAPMAKPPVCRILDYGKFKYQQHKKEADAKKKASTTQVKELRLSYRTDIGDIKRQVDKARAFLEEGDRVKFLLRFRGREMAYQDLGREKLMSVCSQLDGIGTVEGYPRMEGRMMGVLMAPSKKKTKTPAPKPASPSAAKAAPPPAEAPEASEPAAETASS